MPIKFVPDYSDAAEWHKSHKLSREELALLWLQVKREERLANEERLRIEKAIIELGPVSEGSSYINLPDGSAVKIYVGHETEWDQDKVQALQEVWHHISPDIAFPFREEWRPSSHTIALIKEYRPELWSKFLEPASNLKPKKPAFSAK